jgi:hypothetical protein
MNLKKLTIRVTVAQIITPTTDCSKHVHVVLPVESIAEVRNNPNFVEPSISSTLQLPGSAGRSVIVTRGGGALYVDETLDEIEQTMNDCLYIPPESWSPLAA